MPGVIMENGSRNGSHTNHDRDQRLNGINGTSHSPEKTQDKGKGRVEPQQNVTPISPIIPNGLGMNGSVLEASRYPDSSHVVSQDLQDRVGKLPPEILHISQGYMPLSALISRLAQKTHNGLSDTILQMAQMPSPASAVNGNASHSTPVDDNSMENINKKLRMLTFAQDAHTEWVKALVITEWSRKSDDVSKVIDLRIHLNKQRDFYDSAIHDMSMLKRGLPEARVPNPDLKTALQVLSTGKAPWMPELNYIEPPPLTPRDLLHTVEKLNTLLSIRLNLQEYDNTPLQFKDYTIKSGRVTFRVAGEFEVDLTIGDEDPEGRFWFIDFRFLFSPALFDMPAHLRYHVESRVNGVLPKDGLSGCYKILHEMVLTHKISEFRRQAVELARGKWIEGVRVELLNRALSIQYWLDRFGKKGPKSWIILGVHSGRRKNGAPDPKATSRLFIRWFRDAKEVKDVDLQFDTVNISAESLLKAVIAKHVNHILTSTYEQLRAKPLFATHEASVSLSTSSDEPAESVLKVQVSSQEHVSITIEPVTGRFIFSPASPLITKTEHDLNFTSKEPAKDTYGHIENLRCFAVSADIIRHGSSLGWFKTLNPGFATDDLRAIVGKHTAQITWLTRMGWSKDWFVAVGLGMSGEQWWLFERGDKIPPTMPNNPPKFKVATSLKIPVKSVSPTPTYAFLSTLHIFAAALISHYTSLRTLHTRRALHMLRNSIPFSPVRLPSIYVRLSELLPSRNKSIRANKQWAKDIVKLTFQGLEPLPPKAKKLQELPSSTPKSQLPHTPAHGTQPTTASIAQTPLPQGEIVESESTIIITEARMIVLVPAALSILKEKVDKDIAFHAKSGAFAFRLLSKVGESVIPRLIERIVRVERLVDFVEVLHKHEKTLQCENVSLGKIIFSYGNLSVTADAMDVDGAALRSYKAIVDFGGAENTMTLVLERGNPHLRVLDHLTKVLNEGDGLDGVATLLPLTLPALRALDMMEAAWAPLSAKGEAYIFVRAVEWYIVRYNLFPVPSTSDSTSGQLKFQKRIMFEVKMMQRRGDPWWYIRRTDVHEREDDEIGSALKPLWNSSGEGWQGMRVNAVARPDGVEELLGKLDDVLRSMTPGGTKVDASQPAQIQAQGGAPTAPMRQQQRQQQPTPSQSQSQGKNSLKQEVVEID